jgi:hypothetical protein
MRRCRPRSSRISRRGSANLWPGETLRLWLQGSPSSSGRLDKYWGLSDYALPDRRGRSSLRAFTDIVSACDAWGSLGC